MDQIYLDSNDALLDLSPPENLSQPGSSQQFAASGPLSPLAGKDPFTASHRRSFPGRNLEARLDELECENLRLHRLVAELLIKNEQLRKLALAK
jgi:hypothetical protein